MSLRNSQRTSLDNRNSDVLCCDTRVKTKVYRTWVLPFESLAYFERRSQKHLPEMCRQTSTAEGANVSFALLFLKQKQRIQLLYCLRMPFKLLIIALSIQCQCFPRGSLVKNLPAKQEMWIRSLGQEDPREGNGNPPPSILAWETPWTEEPGGLQFMELQGVRHN